jgi:hypothetical protein
MYDIHRFPGVLLIDAWSVSTLVAGTLGSLLCSWPWLNNLSQFTSKCPKLGREFFAGH